MRPTVTLKKLADMLNMSISTVSRALKDHPDISPETRNKVKELAEVLEYEPNTYAINLRTNNRKEFGVIIPTVANYFYHSFISSLEEEVRKYGYSIIILQTGDDPLIELENLKRCKQSRVAGVFVSITSKTEDMKPFIKAEDQEIPVIFFDKVPAYEACNKVCVADAAAAEIAAQAIIQKKKKNVLGLFGDSHLSITKKRLNAFEAVFKQTDEQVKLTLDYAYNMEETVDVFTKHWLKNKPDAVFCMSDEILTGVMKVVQKLKINMPDELGVIAISDGFIPKLYWPDISYVETSGYKLGKLAFSRMMTCMSGHSYKQEISIDTVLIQSNSL